MNLMFAPNTFTEGDDGMVQMNQPVGINHIRTISFGKMFDFYTLEFELDTSIVTWYFNFEQERDDFFNDEIRPIMDVITLMQDRPCAEGNEMEDEMEDEVHYDDPPPPEQENRF